MHKLIVLYVHKLLSMAWELNSCGETKLWKAYIGVYIIVGIVI